jgi:ABC-type Fe3+-hydroxamate transport system substrate-binding protein
MRIGQRVFGLMMVALALVLAGCEGNEPSEQADPSTAPAETAVTADTGAGAGINTGTEPQEPADLAGTAEQISAEFDEMLADLREVDSLDELRADLEDAAASVESWREQLAAAPDDEQLADARASLDQALVSLETTLEDLSSQAEDSGTAGLGDLARELTPDNLGGVSEARSALEELLGTSGSG